MPMYGQSPWAEAGDAVSGMGDSVARIALSQQMGRQRMWQMMQQQAVEQAYLKIAQEKAEQDRAHSQAAVGELQERTAGMKGEREAGESLSKHLGEYGQAERLSQKYNHPELLQMVMKRIAKDQGRLAAMAPGSVSRQVPEIMAAQDPNLRRLMATGTPMYQHVAPGGVIFDAARQEPIFTSPISPYQQQMVDIRRQEVGNITTNRDREFRLKITQTLSDPKYAAMSPELKSSLENDLSGGDESQQADNAPPVGTVYKGYRFKGGDPAKQENWEKVQ